MNVVVTGATSFIGAAAVRRLLAQGDRVCAVVRPGSRNLPALVHSVTPEWRERFVPVELDLGQIERLKEPEKSVFFCPDAWIHAGWEGSGSENRMKRDVQQSNVEQSLKAVRTAAAMGCCRFLFTGSQAEYGVHHNEILTEEAVCRPVSEYGKAKADFLAEAEPLCNSLKMEYIHIRIFSVYGPGDHAHALIPSSIRTWLQNGDMEFGACTQQWNYLYIEDAADALCRLLTEGEAGTYNLAGSDTRSLWSYIEEMHALCGGKGGCRYGVRPENAEGPADLMPDITKLLARTGWRPRTSFAEGVRRTMDAMAKAQGQERRLQK